MTPREAVSVILLREAPEGHQELLVERNPEQRFMGGAWVFPGGATHPEDDSLEATGRRELEEEAGVRLPPDADLVPFSRWITPVGIPVRFDTWFFAVEAPAGTVAEPDGNECVDARWLRPSEALAAHGRGELKLVFPTIKHLELLDATKGVAATLAAARAREVEPVLPKVIEREGAPAVLLPGEPGYEDA